MKDRRHNLHERLVAKILINYAFIFTSILEDDSWEDSTLPRPLHTKIVIMNNNWQ